MPSLSLLLLLQTSRRTTHLPLPIQLKYHHKVKIATIKLHTVAKVPSEVAYLSHHVVIIVIIIVAKDQQEEDLSASSNSAQIPSQTEIATNAPTMHFEDYAFGWA